MICFGVDINRLTPNLSDVFASALDALSRRTAVAVPGSVLAYDPLTRTAIVQPAVRRLVPLSDDPDTDVAETIPAIHNVPVCWPCGANFAVVGLLTIGDPVLLIAMDNDIAQWRVAGATSDPLDARTHSWASAVAIPGLRPDAGSFLIPPTDAAALSSLVFAELSALQATVEALVTAFNDHIHPAPGGATSAVAVLLQAAPPAAVAPMSSTVLLLGG